MSGPVEATAPAAAPTAAPAPASPTEVEEVSSGQFDDDDELAPSEVVADGPLALAAIILTVVSFVIGQAGTSVSYLRFSQADYAHLINEGVVGTAGVMAAVGLALAALALVISRDVVRSWRQDVAAAALLLGVISAGLHGTIWGLSIQHTIPPQVQSGTP